MKQNSFVKKELKAKIVNEQHLKNAVITHLSDKIFEITQRRPLIIPIVVDLKTTSI